MSYRSRIATGCALLAATGCGPAGKDSPPPVAAQAPQITEALPEVNGTELFVKRIGSGEPLVVVHGGPVLEHGYLLPHLAPLTEDYELVFYDQRLSGRSAGTTPTESVRVATFVDDIEGLRQKLDLGSIHLMAHSWGGLLAMRYAVRYGENLQSLVLLDSMAASSELWRAEEAALGERISAEEQAELQAHRETAAFQERHPEAIATMLRMSFRKQFADADNADLLKLYVPEDYVARSSQFGAMMVDLESFDFHADLASVATPTLVVYGSEEPGAALGGAAIVAALPGATLSIIPKAGHFPFIENPAAFFSVIGEFLGTARN